MNVSPTSISKVNDDNDTILDEEISNKVMALLTSMKPEIYETYTLKDIINAISKEFNIDIRKKTQVIQDAMDTFRKSINFEIMPKNINRDDGYDDDDERDDNPLNDDSDEDSDEDFNIVEQHTKKYKNFQGEAAVRCSSTLANFLGIEMIASKNLIRNKIWNYIIKNSLQDKADHRYINLDEPLKKALQSVGNDLTRRVHVLYLKKVVNKHFDN